MWVVFVFFFFNIKTTDIKLEAVVHKIKVVLLSFDPNMLYTGLTSACSPVVAEAL